MATQHRNAPDLRRPGQTAHDAREVRRRGRADRIEQADRSGPHRRQVVDVHQGGAPSRPLRIAFDHRRDDGIARGDEVGAGHGGTVVTAEPAAAQPHPRVGERRECGGEHGFGRVDQSLHRTDRPPHHHVGHAVHRGPIRRDPADRREHRRVPRLHHRVEPQHPGRLHERARGSHECRTHGAATTPPRDDEPASRPPAGVGFRSGCDTHAAQNRAVGSGGHQDHRAGIVVHLVEVGAVEQPLLDHEGLPAQRPVRGQIGDRFCLPHQERCGGRRGWPGENGQVDGHVSRPSSAGPSRRRRQRTPLAGRRRASRPRSAPRRRGR
ncbi:hypothetical protein RhoFasK5_02999|nr:hypothetical protein [Rhodococcus kroppenstedtii]